MNLRICALLFLVSSPVEAQIYSHISSAPAVANPEPDWLSGQTFHSAPSLSPPPRISGSSEPFTVSVAALAVPPAAVEEFRIAQKLFRTGKLRASTEHLEKALRIYPNYPEAHNTLGVAYSQLRELDKALAEFRAASLLDARFVEPVANQSAMLFALDRYAEAECAARRALALDPGHKAARYLLGRILAARNGASLEAFKLLRDSSRDFPAAHLALADLLVRKGLPEEAATELRAYLALPEPSEKLRAERSLARLVAAAATETALLSDF